MLLRPSTRTAGVSSATAAALLLALMSAPQDLLAAEAPDAEIGADGVFPAVTGGTPAAPPVRLLRGVAPDGGGHGTPPQRTHDEISPEQREAIWRQLRRNLAALPPRAEAGTTAVQPTLDWPLRASAQLSDPGYHGVSNFVDHNPAVPNQLLDYQCGGRTYDSVSGYNHQGIDYFTWPFSWQKLAKSSVEIVAAASGRIVGKADGNPDQSCGFNNNPWNAVYVEHADGSIAWYGHMKNGSLTNKAVGDAVKRGDFLGVVGSSGNSTGPHLHLELYDAAGTLADPYLGSCNAIPQSWWKAQRPYADSALNQVTTGHLPPSFPTCPGIETPNIRDSFNPGDRVYFTSYYRDQQAGQLTSFSITRPDGSLYSSWSHNAPNTYAASWWYWFFTMPSTGPTGTWKFSVNYLGKTVDRFFNLGSPTFVTVKVPNGGAAYTRGSTLKLKWTSNIGGPLRVELWRQGSFVNTLFAATPNDGQQNWVIPTTLAPGNYKIQLVNLADETVLDSSNKTFQIQ